METCVLDFLLYSNLYLACGTAIVALVATVLMGHPVSWGLLLMAFANGFFIYTLNRFTDLEEDRINVPGRVSYFARYGHLFLGASSLTYAIALVLAYRISWHAVLMLLTPLLIGLFYSYGGLKRLIIGKSLAVATAWGSTVLLVGVVYMDNSPRTWLLFGFFTFEFFANTVIFDVKDIDGDRLHRIRTLPVTIGLDATKGICHALNGAAALMIIVGVSFGILPLSAILLLSLNGYILLYTTLCSERRGRLFFGLFVDGEFMFLLVVFLGGRYFVGF